MTEPQLPPRPPRHKMLIMTVGVEGGLLLLAVLLGMMLGVEFWIDRMGTVGDIWIGILLSVPMVLSIIHLCEGSTSFLNQSRTDMERLGHMLSRCRPIDLAFIALAAGVCEEAFFRGFMQEYLTSLFGLWPAIIVTSIAFGLMHAVSFAYFIATVVISVFLGLIYHYCDGLAAPMALHAFYDYCALIYVIHLRPLRPRFVTDT